MITISKVFTEKQLHNIHCHKIIYTMNTTLVAKKSYCSEETDILLFGFACDLCEKMHQVSCAGKLMIVMVSIKNIWKDCLNISLNSDLWKSDTVSEARLTLTNNVVLQIFVQIRVIFALMSCQWYEGRGAKDDYSFWSRSLYGGV